MSGVVAPYSGPWLEPDPKTGKLRYKGPAAIAFKRTISRGWDDASGDPLIPWRYFNDQHNEVLATAVRKIKWGKKWDVDGNIGARFFNLLRNRRVPEGRPHAGEWAMDAVSVELLKDAYEIKFPPAPPPLVAVREALSEYLRGMENFRNYWHYSQARPYRYLGVDPSRGGIGDCSSLVHTAYFWARRESGIAVPDPSGYNYTGYGNTQSIWNRNNDRKVSGEYEVGDVALYGPSYDTKHITICRKAGDVNHAIFTSHGSSAGPNPTIRTYRTRDFLAVLRPPLRAIT